MKNVLIGMVTLWVSSSAFASTTCTSSAVVGGEETGMCATMAIPNYSSVSSTMKCNNFKIAVAADLHSQPNSLSLTIYGGDGTAISTSSGNDLKLVDPSGNGAIVRCNP